MDCFELQKAKGYYYALLSALLFGASIPAVKWLLDAVNPLVLAGLLYSSSAIGLITIAIFRKFVLNIKTNSVFNKSNVWKLVTISSLLGGIIGPALLFFGLFKTNASAASLLLIFENVFTIVLAWLVFKEKTDRHTVIGICLIILGSLELVWNNELNFNNLLGVLLIIAACLCWAFENNIVKKIAAEDPVLLALIKSLAAGITNIAIGLMMGVIFPSQLNLIMRAFLVGMFGYAFSIVCFILALRHIGAMRTGGCFAIAPFIGAGLSVLLLDENLSFQLIIAGLLMAGGIIFHFFKIFTNNNTLLPNINAKTRELSISLFIKN